MSRKDEVLRVTSAMVDLHRAELCDWLTGLGVDPATVRPEFVIRKGEREYELHLTEFVLNENGRRFLDLVTEEIVTKPLVVPLGTSETWPRVFAAIPA